jgi:hypothetical protein
MDQADRIQQTKLSFSQICSQDESRKQCEESIQRELERTRETLTRWVGKAN